MRISTISLLVAAAINQAVALLPDDHFYTIDPTGESAPQEGYVLDGVTAWVPDDFVVDIEAVFRWVNPSTSAHFWTADPLGEEASELGFNFDGLSYYLFDVHISAPIGALPLYRFAVANDNHFYTMNFTEGLAEGPFDLVVGYAYPTAVENTKALFRWSHS